MGFPQYQRPLPPAHSQWCLRGKPPFLSIWHRTDSGTDPGIDVPEMASMDMMQVEEEKAALSPVQTSSSLSSPDEAVTGLSNLFPLEDFMAHQDFLKNVAANLGLEVEELKICAQPS